MESLKGIFCSVVGVVCGIAVNLLGGWDSGRATPFICIVLDYVTGLIVAGVFNNSTKTRNGALESGAGLKGLVRKIMMIALIAVAYRIDILMDTSYVRYTVIIGFICNEVISLIENAGLMGVPIPNVLTKAIDVLKNKGDDKNE